MPIDNRTSIWATILALGFGRMHSSGIGVAEPDPDASYVAIGIASSGSGGAIALQRVDRRAAGAVRRRRTGEFGRKRDRDAG